MNPTDIKINNINKKVNDFIVNADFYDLYNTRINNGSIKRIKAHRISQTNTISLDWLEFVEDCIVPLDNIVRNPRKFIVQEEDIVDISLARSISTESVKHLAQHTNMISSVDEKGMVLPNKILNVTKEESLEIYENRFIFTLLNNLKMFIDKRIDRLKDAQNTADVLELKVESLFTLPSKKIKYNLECRALMPAGGSKVEDKYRISERIDKVNRIINDFFSSPFCKSMSGSAPVRPPITRTNVILKNTNFKKALTLWQFIETYDKMGIDTIENQVNEEISEEFIKQIKDAIILNTLLVERLAGDSSLITKDNDFEVQEEVLPPPPEVPELPKPDEEKLEEVPEIEEEEEEKELEENLAEIYNEQVKYIWIKPDYQLSKARIRIVNKMIDRVLDNYDAYLDYLQVKKTEDQLKEIEREEKRFKARIMQRIRDFKKCDAEFERKIKKDIKQNEESIIARERKFSLDKLKLDKKYYEKIANAKAVEEELAKKAMLLKEEHEDKMILSEHERKIVEIDQDRKDEMMQDVRKDIIEKRDLLEQYKIEVAHKALDIVRDTNVSIKNHSRFMAKLKRKFAEEELSFKLEFENNFEQRVRDFAKEQILLLAEEKKIKRLYDLATVKLNIIGENGDDKALRTQQFDVEIAEATSDFEARKIKAEKEYQKLEKEMMSVVNEFISKKIIPKYRKRK